MSKHGGENPPSYKEIELWVESESRRRHVISLRDEAHHLQSDEMTGAIPVEPATAERKDLTMSIVSDNNHYPPYDTCANLISDQDKSKLMKGHPVKNPEADLCASLKQERVDQGLLCRISTLMGRSQNKGATASIADTNVGNMTGLDE